MSKVTKKIKKEFMTKSMNNKKNISQTEKTKSSNKINNIKRNIIKIIDKDEKEKENNQTFNKESTIDTRLNTVENKHIISHSIKTKNTKTENDNINTKKINNLDNIKTYTKTLNSLTKHSYKNFLNHNKDMSAKNSIPTYQRDNLNLIANINKSKKETPLNKYKDNKIYHSINYKCSERSSSHLKYSDIPNKKKQKISTFDKRKKYIVPVIKKKRKNITFTEENNKIIQNEIDENKEETKGLLASKLIENKQIELLKDYQKYMDEFSDKIYKNNEKKFRFIQEEGIELNDLLKDNKININQSLYEVNEKEEVDPSMENKNNNTNENNNNTNKIKEDNLNININSNLNDELKTNKNENNSPSNKEIQNEIINNMHIDEDININNEQEIIGLNKGKIEDNLEHIKNVIHNKRKPKIDTFEYLLKINNNIDQNKIINFTSEINQKNENKEENNEENNIEKSSSSDYVFNNKHKRKKGEIIEFMKSNRQKIKDMEMKKKEDKENAEMKKFMEIIKLEKDIEDNKKINKMSNSNKNRHIFNNKITREANDFYIRNNPCEDNNNLKLSVESSISSFLNQRDFYINCYETQQIYATQDNFISLFKTEPNISREDKNKVSANDEVNNLYDNYCGNNFNVSGIKKKKKKNNGDKNIHIKNINLIKEKNNSKKIDYNEMKKVIDKLSCFMEKYKKSSNKTDNNIKGKLSQNENISRNSYLKQDENIVFGNNNNKKYNTINNSTMEKNNDINGGKINGNNSLQNNIAPLFKISKGLDSKTFDINSEENSNFALFQSNGNIKEMNPKKENKEDINNNYVVYEKKQECNDVINNINNKEIGNINNIDRSLIKTENISLHKNKEETKYNFSKEELDNYNEIFTPIFTYLKLIINRNTFNDIISYAEYKYRYKIGFEQLIILFKYKPFNNLRLLQQNEYYQVILKQFCIPYIRRTFNKIKLHVYIKERIEEANRILKQIYIVTFFKRLLVFIEAKENNYYNYQIEQDKIIEEEKEYKSNESSVQNNKSKIGNNNLDKSQNAFVDDINIKNYNEDNNNINDKNLSNNEEKEGEIENTKMDINNFVDKLDKEIDQEDNEEINNNDIINNKNLEEFMVVLDNLFNIFSFEAKRYSFYKLYGYYSNIIEKTNKNNNGNVIEDNQKIENVSNNISNQKCYSYLYESLSEKSSIYACPNSEGNDGLHKIYVLFKQKQNDKENNEDNSEIKKDDNDEENVRRNENNIIKQDPEFGEEKDNNNKQKENKSNIYNKEIQQKKTNEEKIINDNSQNKNNTDKEKKLENNQLENDLVNPYKEYYFQHGNSDISYEPEDNKDNDAFKNKSEENKDYQNLENRHSLIAEKLKNSFRNNYGFLNDSSVMKNISDNNDKTEKINSIKFIQNINKSIENKDIHNSENLNTKEIKEIKDLKDIESNIFSEKEADLDENIANIENYVSSEKSHEETEEKGKNNNSKNIKNENNGIDRNIGLKNANNQYFSLKEIYDKINDSLIKKENKITSENKKRFYNSFGGNENVNLKLNDNSSHSSIIKMKKDKLMKSLNEEKEVISNINLDNLGYFLHHKSSNKSNSNKFENVDEKEGSKNTQRNIFQKKYQTIPQFLNKEYNNDKKFNTHKVAYPIKKEENKLFSSWNEKIYNSHNLNEILKRANDENNDSNINEKKDEKESKLNRIIDDDNNGSFSFKLNSDINNKYNGLDNKNKDSEDIINYSESINTGRKTEQQIYNEKIMNQLTEEMVKKIEEEMANSILSEILSNEIDDRKNIFRTKKRSNKSNYSFNSYSYSNSLNNKSFQSSSPKMNALANENLEVCPPSPGRKKSKSGNISLYLVNNKYNTFFVFSSPIKNDENSLTNTSILMKNLQEKKKEEELSYYNKIILPKFLEVIKANIMKKYYFLIKNLKIPLKIDEEKLLVDLSLQITFKKIYDKNSLFLIEKNYINENINKEVLLNENILLQFNKENKYNEYIQNLNKCVFDAANEVIQSQRLYGKIAEPLSWSLRFKEIDYKYKDTRFFKDLFINNIIKEINNLICYRIGMISDNSSKIPKDRNIIEKSIYKELKEDETWQNFDEEETIIKLMVEKIIMNHLMKETVEILEHVQFSRKNPEKYCYKSIFACEKIPFLSFQNKLINRIKTLEISGENDEDGEDDEDEEDDEEEEEEEDKEEDNYY